MSRSTSEAATVDLVEIERCALNETFAATGSDWQWDPETHRSLRRVGGIARQLDEYGCRTGELLNYEQLTRLRDDAVRRFDALVLAADADQPDQAWVA